MDSKGFTLRFVDRILDPVHGFIDITDVERRIIELPIFRRLQSIKQLSMTNWVFPGAEHTRFIHSLGVMHIADQMMLQLEGFDDKARQLIRLSGLLHDIGHYPLSHVTESAYRDRLKEYDGTLKAHNDNIMGRINNLNKIETPGYMKSRYSDKMHHECIGTAIIACDERIRTIINEECPFIDIEDIRDIIAGNVDRKPSLSVFVQLMHSELDADGIDYIMRDASFAGTSYGNFELGMLLRNLTTGYYQGTQIVGVKSKGIPIVDQYLINKYFSYTQIIFNKHVAILDLMVEKITHALINHSGSKYPNPKDLMKWIKMHNDMNNDDYLLFTDVFFWSQMSNINTKSAYIDEEYVRILLDDLIHYREPEYVDDIAITDSDVEKVQQKIINSIPYNRLNIGKNEILMLHIREFTKEIPTEEYNRRIKNVWNAGDKDNLYFNENTKRLQEGIAVIETDSEPHLLVDDPRSLMYSLWRNKTYIMRRYRCGHI